MRYMIVSIFAILVLLCSMPRLHAQQPATSLTFRTPDGVQCVITADGLSSIRVGNREVAKGGWHCGSAEWYFKIGTGKVQTGKITEKTITVLNPTHARVRHVQQDIVTTYDYTFDGNDLTIAARVENSNDSDEMLAAQFSGLAFTFTQPPTGIMPVQHYTYFRFHGIGLCHPSHWQPIGGSYATDDGIGIGFSPWKTGLARTLIIWDYADWVKQEKGLVRNLAYTVVSSVPPLGARTYWMKMRLSTNKDWKFLLAPYKEYFQATYAPLQYHSDYRWIATTYANKSQQAISATNPYGFHEGAMRLDLPEGVKAFCDHYITALQQSNGQGMLIWGQGGDDPRGGMYRPDFDILPPEVEAQWPTLAQRFKDANLHLGVATRPRHMAVRANWKSDQIIDINPNDPGHRDMLWHRFKNMIDKGCTIFYLDSFGDSFEDVELMQYLRKQMGPDIQTFCEHQCDAVMPYSGGYSESTFSGDKEGKSGKYVLWSGLTNWEVYRWLVPGSQMATRLFQVQGKIPDGFEPMEHFFLSKGVQALLPNANPTVKNLKEIEAEFLDEKGQWKAK